MGSGKRKERSQTRKKSEPVAVPGSEHEDDNADDDGIHDADEGVDEVGVVESPHGVVVGGGGGGGGAAPPLALPLPHTQSSICLGKYICIQSYDLSLVSYVFYSVSF
jgi:hypothetical protein